MMGELKLRRKMKEHVDFIEIGFSFHMREQLSLIWRYSLHQYCKVRQILQEALVIEGVEIIARLMQTFKAPTNNLARERFVFALNKVFGHNFTN